MDFGVIFHDLLILSYSDPAALIKIINPQKTRYYL